MIGTLIGFCMALIVLLPCWFFWFKVRRLKRRVRKKCSECDLSLNAAAKVHDSLNVLLQRPAQ